MHEFVEYNPQSKEVIRKISNEMFDTKKLKYAADVVGSGNKTVLLANWGGHSKGSKPQPQVIEFDEDYNIVWQYMNEEIGNISAIGIK